MSVAHRRVAAPLQTTDVTMTDAATDSDSSKKGSSAALRKIKKPIIERKRRERINESLNQVKTLVLDALNKDESRFSKMEKADILEMTVTHLKSLQNQPQSPSTPTISAATRYKAGFNECAREVQRYLASLDGVSHNVHERLTMHLEGVAKRVGVRTDTRGISIKPNLNPVASSQNTANICANTTQTGRTVSILPFHNDTTTVTGSPVTFATNTGSSANNGPIAVMSNGNRVPVLSLLPSNSTQFNGQVCNLSNMGNLASVPGQTFTIPGTGVLLTAQQTNDGTAPTVFTIVTPEQLTNTSGFFNAPVTAVNSHSMASFNSCSLSTSSFGSNSSIQSVSIPSAAVSPVYAREAQQGTVININQANRTVIEQRQIKPHPATVTQGIPPQNPNTHHPSKPAIQPMKTITNARPKPAVIKPQQGFKATAIKQEGLERTISNRTAPEPSRTPLPLFINTAANGSRFASSMQQSPGGVSDGESGGSVSVSGGSGSPAPSLSPASGCSYQSVSSPTLPQHPQHLHHQQYHHQQQQHLLPAQQHPAPDTANTHKGMFVDPMWRPW